MTLQKPRLIGRILLSIDQAITRVITPQEKGEEPESQPWIVYLLKMHEAAEVITMVIISSTKYRGLKLEEVMRRLSERQCRALLAAPEKYRIALAEHICFAVKQGLDPPSSVELERMWREAQA